MVANVPTQLESEARRLLREHATSVAGIGSRQALDACESILPRMLDMLAQLHDRPAYAMRPVIRRCLEERVFIDATTSDHADLVPLLKEAELLVEVLEQVRLLGEQRGLWSQLAPEPMCG